MSRDSGTAPNIVMIIRHGEKPGDPTDDKDGGPDLSVRGAARAAALPSLFLPATRSLECALKRKSAARFAGRYLPSKACGPGSRFSTPDFLFATAESSASRRPKQTITPVSAALGLSINHDYGDRKKDIDALAGLLRTARYAEKTILICWHHGTIQQLAIALNATGATPWAGTEFDRLWLIDYRDSPSIRQYGQQLLFGDGTDVPPAPW